MKVSLINPGRKKQYSTTPPVNLCILASYLEQNNIEVEIIDELSGDNVREKLSKFSPDIVGITGTTPLIIDTYRIARISKQMGFKTIIGGVHASILPEEAIQHCDAVITGEGEEALLSLTRDFKCGIIKGTYISNLDSISTPAWHLINMKYYLTVRDRVPMSFLSFALPRNNTGVLLTSRGCPWSCTFCHNSFKDKPFRYNSPERVVQEIEFLIKGYNVRSIFFIEDNFFANNKRVEKICNLIIEKNIDLIWGANSRVDNINKDILELAKRAGCKQVTFGWESGSQRILDLLNKRTTVEQNIESVRLCNEVGILSNGTVMLGNPYETVEDIRLTQKFILENNIDGGVGVCITTPFPGTVLWNWCKENNKIPEKFWWSDFDYHQVPIQVCDIPLEKFLSLVNETTNIAINKYFSGLK